jgi:hypothetical protein
MAFWSMGKFTLPVADDVDVLFIVAPVAVVLKLFFPCQPFLKWHYQAMVEHRLS